MKVGYREQFWKKNCVAIGMSAGFVEPLEASAIYLLDAAANMIADLFPRTQQAMGCVADKFNKSFTMRMDRSIDFIKLHYCISKRRDTQYWVDSCAAKTVPKSLQNRLDHWQYSAPSRYDFDYSFEPFVLDSYLYVLYGMGFEADVTLSGPSNENFDLAKVHFENVDRVSEMLTSELPTQRDLVEKVYKYGFGRV